MCLQVYGFLFGMNRNKQSTLEVVVDTWPDFKVIICRPDAKVNQAPPILGLLAFIDQRIFATDSVLNFIIMVTPQNKRALGGMKKVAYYSMDEQVLRAMLTEESTIDWSTYFLIGGEQATYHAGYNILRFNV